MFAMLGEAAIGLVCIVAAGILIFIGMPKRGVQPRFMQSDAVMMLYPSAVITFLAFGVGLMLRAYTVG